MTTTPSGAPSPSEHEAETCFHMLKFYIITDGYNRVIGWEKRCVKCGVIFVRGSYNPPHVHKFKVT